MSTTKKELYKKYGKALTEGNAALFAGAGLSVGSGYVNWKVLMKDIVEELGLKVELENDLISVAQFHVTKRGGSRHDLDQLIVDEFKTRAKLTPNHKILSQLNIGCIWTTNYDKLLEKAFEAIYKVPDVKITEPQFSRTTPNRDVVIYKMHGDVDDAEKAVITKDDYLSYSATHGFFQTALKGDLLSKTFLFLGYSFNDPNIEFMLGSLNFALKGNARTHFCVMRLPKKHQGTPEDLDETKKTQEDWDEEYRYDCIRFALRKADLLRYGVETVEIAEYDEVTEILLELKRQSRLRDVFVSGSAHDPLPLGQTPLESLAYRLGKEIIQRKCNLISGFGLGVGSLIIAGAMEELYRDSTREMNRRLTLRPFPQPTEGQSREEMLPLWSDIRSEMISNAGFCVFLSGNKLQDGQVISAPGILGESGVKAEWELCKEQGKYPIPIGASGHAARIIYEEVVADLDKFYPGIDVSKQFDVLGDENAGEEAWIKAIFAIITAATKPAKS